MSCHHAECPLSVIILCAVMLRVIILSHYAECLVIIVSVLMLRFINLSAVILSFLMLSVLYNDIVKAWNCQRNDENNINRTTGIIDLGFKNYIY